jgi:predicted metal-binding membrane protein
MNDNRRARRFLAALVAVAVLALAGIVWLSLRLSESECRSRAEGRANVRGAFTDLVDVL